MGGVSGSLAGRMAERADYLQKHDTAWFGIPGFEDILEVELRALSYKTSVGIRERLNKVHDTATRELYALADTITFATEGFRQVYDEDPTPLPDDDWVSLARGSRTRRPR